MRFSLDQIRRHFLITRSFPSISLKYEFMKRFSGSSIAAPFAEIFRTLTLQTGSVARDVTNLIDISSWLFATLAH